MWVLGDLKDQLGIQHHRERRKGDIEQTPMFEPDYDEQSPSEAGSADIPYDEMRDPRGVYVPAGTQSPPTGIPRQNPTFSSIPPDRRPGPVDVGVSYVVDDGDIWDTLTPTQRTILEPPISRTS